MPNTGGPLGKQTSVWWDLKITFVKFNSLSVPHFLLAPPTKPMFSWKPLGSETWFRSLLSKDFHKCLARMFWSACSGWLPWLAFLPRWLMYCIHSHTLFGLMYSRFVHCSYHKILFYNNCKILARSLANFYCQWADRHTKMTSDVARALSQRKIKAKSTRNLSLLL